MAELGRLQRWMQAVIVAPGADAEAFASASAVEQIPAAQAGSVVLPSRTLTGEERVAIYRDMYLVRMRDALRTDYPGVAHFLGEDRFHRLVADYVAAHPSCSYTLNRLGDRFPEFVRTAPLPRREFVHDLARLELAVTEVFDAEESPALAPAAIAAVPADAWDTARLVPITALQLVAFDYPVSAYLQSVKDSTPHPSTRRRNTWVAVFRRDYAMSRQDLTRDAYEMLSTLVSGATLGDAVRSAPRAKEEQLFQWFREWMAEGLFQRVIGSPHWTISAIG
jgi:hypothetical protein